MTALATRRRAIPLAILGVVVLLVVSSEVALRAWAHHARVPFERFDDASGTYRLVPGVYPSEHGGEIHINAAGLRGAALETPTPGKHVRIVTVGDSCTFGADEETATYPWSLGTQMTGYAGGQIRYEVVNAGVAGADSRDALRRFVSVVAPLEPDIVVIYVGWNDLMKRAPLSQQGGSAAASLSDRIDRLWLVRAGRKLVFQHLRTLGPGPVTGAASRSGRFAEFEPGVYRAHLTRLVRSVQDAGARPILVTLATPLREGMSAELVRNRGIFFPFFFDANRVGDFLDLIAAYNRTVREVARAESVPLADIAVAIEAAADPMPLFWDTMHMNREGQTWMASLIASSMTRAGLLVPPSPVGGASR